MLPAHTSMKPIVLSILLSCIIFAPEIAQAQPKIVTAKQVNGTWKSKFGTFKILALGQQRLQVEFSGVYPLTAPDGTRSANLGIGTGIATIERRTAKFKPDGADERCSIMMNFVDSGLKV